MSQPTPDNLNRPGEKDEQQTLLQWPNIPQDGGIVTGIKAATEAPRLEVGPVPLTRVANYELLKEIGRGGMGVVFKARDVRLNRIVALKMIRGGTLANSDERQRFEKEAAAAAQLQHPNIVALYEVSPYDQQPFLSMEYIGGTSLAERLSLGPLSGRRAAEYLEQTARAVHYAHTRGIVHRDLKPANVLLDENDQPKITDFGLAKQMETPSDQTRTGAILGTPSYMSPEQAAGTKNIRPASDIYSLGAILYELLTGKAPFCGETPLKTLSLVAEQDPIAPRLLNPAVDRDLETICLKCLEKSASRRYETADSLADDLRRYLGGEPITARRVGLIGRGIKWVRRNPAATGVSAFVVLTVVTFIAMLTFENYQEKELRTQAEDAKEIAERAKERAAISLEGMRHLLYLSEMRQAQLTLRRADLDGVERILNERWQPKKDQSDLRDWEWYFLKDRAESRLAFGSHVGRSYAVAYSPDGKYLASAGGPVNRPGEIKIWEVRSGKLLRTLTGHENKITALAYHPERPLLASASFDSTIKLWNPDTGTETVTLRGHTNNVYAIAFSPKGEGRKSERLASASHDLTVRVWAYDLYQPNKSDNHVTVLKGHDKPVTSVAFHPDAKSQTLASGSRDRTIKIWNLETRQIEKSLTGHDGEVTSLEYTPNGKTLVSGGGAGTQAGELFFWDVDAGKIRVGHYGLSDRVLHLSVSRDSKVAAAGSDGIVRIWHSAVSSEALSFRADPQTATGVAFAPDGFSLASTGLSGRVSLWNSSAGSETLNLAAPNNTRAVAFSPKGGYLAAAGASPNELRVWNLDDADHPEQPIYSERQGGAVLCLAFSPDGHYVAVGGQDRVVRIVDFRNRDKAPLLLEGHSARVNAVAYHPEGRWIASAAGEEETILLHNLADGKLFKKLTGHTNGVLCLAFSLDGRWLASGGWDKTVRLWDLTADSPAIVFEGHTGTVNAVAFSPESRAIASASSDKTIRVWEIDTRAEWYKLEGTPGPVMSIAFHPRGRRLVSAGEDRMIRLWDIVTRQEILDFEEHVGALRSVAFSADGRALAGAGNGVVRVWQASRDMPDARK